MQTESTWDVEVVSGFVLNLAHEYRSPENLLRTALMPAFKETLQANAALGTEQEEYGEDRKTIFVVRKVRDEDGLAKRKKQRFLEYGITVVSARARGGAAFIGYCSW